jgi:hypothetical protein
MHILKPIATPQELVVIERPAEDGDGTLLVTLYDESTRTTASVNPSSVTEIDGLTAITAIFSLVAERSYVLTIKRGANLKYRGKVYVTAQESLDKYTTNKDKYVSEQSLNNQFVIL